MRGPGAKLQQRHRAVGGVECRQVALDAFLDLLLALLDLGGREVPVTTVDRLELAAVDSNSGLREELEVSAQHHEAAADVTYARAVVVPEVRDGLEVRRQAPRQPHHLDVALALAFQPPAAL